ncbi:hypothetical protein MUP77_17445 [Candidatus Bathyarchaeota archaeon]|nr:hypothetical protein [Candidatus Bathyarchaeota archaeon]
MELSSVPTKDIRHFLPNDPVQQRRLEELKQETGKEWEQKGKPGRRGDYITRYSIARLFQELKKARKRRNYAGFENIIHLSSGIVRDFLEPCYLMFARLLDQGKNPEDIKEIPPALQDQVLFEYSEEFVIHKFQSIRRGLPIERWNEVDALATLITSLGKLFFERLHDPDAREVRLFSFTVRGQISPEIERVLQLGLDYRYLQLRSYSTKEGGGRERWYILNRRVCPAYKLDPTGFEGRISIKADLLKIACEDTDRFVKMRLKAQDDSSSLFSLEGDL